MERRGLRYLFFYNVRALSVSYYAVRWCTLTLTSVHDENLFSEENLYYIMHRNRKPKSKKISLL